MFIKQFNTNNYVFIEKNKYINQKHFYEEIMNIKFNKKQIIQSPITEIKSKLKQLKK